MDPKSTVTRHAAESNSKVDVRTIQRLRIRTHLRGGTAATVPSGGLPKDIPPPKPA
jgi:hypothetical protein